MINISIKTIPHKKQRYPTVGDYFQDGNKFKICVSDCKNKNFEMLVALHEFVESYLCEVRGIKESDITKFDEQFEMEREKGLHSVKAEPGNHINAPYKNEHNFSTTIELMMANELGVDWAEYENILMNL